MSCDLCGVIRREIRSEILYEDDLIIAMLHPAPAVMGHIIILPKEHYAILEQVPSSSVARIFLVANKISSLLFQALGLAGTNIFVQNGVSAGQKEPHVMVHVIPRRENDNLPLIWQPRKAEEHDLSTAELKIKDAIGSKVFTDKDEADKPINLDKDEVKNSSAVESKSTGESEVNYLIKQLERIP